jgi:hypothetical protein
MAENLHTLLTEFAACKAQSTAMIRESRATIAAQIVDVEGQNAFSQVIHHRDPC